MGNVSTTKTPYRQILVSHLDAIGVPDRLRQQLNYDAPAMAADCGVWPPRPGCCQSPDLAMVRMWARIDLTEWITTAPSVFGPHGTGALTGLAAMGERLRRAGEGTQVLWGIDVVLAEQWVNHHSAGLAVAELVCLGPWLPGSLLTEIDSGLARLGWWYNSERGNSPCTVNRVSCFENSWHEGNTRSAFPAAARCHR